jgi:hypothetical protein
VEEANPEKPDREPRLESFSFKGHVSGFGMSWTVQSGSAAWPMLEMEDIMGDLLFVSFRDMEKADLMYSEESWMLCPRGNWGQVGSQKLTYR